jgi:LSD1 subclass zinc finger protein
LCGCRRVLSYVVGDDIIRAACGHLDPETLHFVVFGKPLDWGSFFSSLR